MVNENILYCEKRKFYQYFESILTKFQIFYLYYFIWKVNLLLNMKIFSELSPNLVLTLLILINKFDLSIVLEILSKIKNKFSKTISIYEFI